MTTLRIQLSEDVRDKLLERARKAGFASLEEHVTALIAADVGGGDDESGGPAHLCVNSLLELEARLDEGAASPTSEMTDVDWAHMRERFLERQRNKGV